MNSITEPIDQLLANIKTSMDTAVASLKPDLDEIEESIIKNYRMFGASDRDIEATRKWLRPMMEHQARQFLLEKFKEEVDKKRNK